MRKHADLDRVYQTGQRYFSGYITTFYLRRSEGAPRVGFTVGRTLGGAVQRNRIRRRLREAVRLQLQGLRVPVDVVINPKRSAATVDFSDLLEQVGHAFAVIAARVEKVQG